MSSSSRIKAFWKKTKTATVKLYIRLTRKPIARVPISPDTTNLNPNERHDETSEPNTATANRSRGETSSQIDNEAVKKRKPPARATELDFPSCRPQRARQNQINENQDLIKAFSNIARKGPSKHHLEALNVSLEENVPLGLLMPDGYIPPLSWAHNPTTAEGYQMLALTRDPSPRLSNNAPIPTRKVFYDAVKELLYDYEDVFRALRRQTPVPGRQPVRVSYFRKFWDGLITMAGFWDTSTDQYTSKNSGDPTSNSGGENSAMDIDDFTSEVERVDGKEKTLITAEDSRLTEPMYTGRRIGTGYEMPETFRSDTVFSFVETVIGAFRCKLDVAQFQHQKLNIQGMNVGLPMAGSVYRIPGNQAHARKGMKEGPMLGVFPRGQTSFRGPRDKLGDGKIEIHDLLWEVGLMLMLAQKRAREGKLEETPGIGKWWANARRWGGRPGGRTAFAGDDTLEDPALDEDRQQGEIQEDNTARGAVPNSNQQPKKHSVDEMVDAPETHRNERVEHNADHETVRESDSHDNQQQEDVAEDEMAAAPRTYHPQPRKYRRTAGSWPDVQPPSGDRWEKNVKFLRVGRPHDSDYDNVGHCGLFL